MKILKLFLILSSLFIFLNADDDYHKKHKYKNLEYLKLDDNQIKQMRNILIKYKNKYEEFYEFKEDKEDELEDLIKEDSFDRKKYTQILTNIHTKAIELQTQRMEEIFNILNKKQRKKFAKYHEEWEID
jgi:Spy/CpxP family protein refolding chaperone